jgi:beta-lactamase regulating signal transducer with metallopeptidase domain
MTTLANWLSPTVMHSLGWALLHSVWQGTGLAAVAAAAMSICHRASVRYVVGVGALALMLAAPVWTFFVLSKPGTTSTQRAASAEGKVAGTLPSANSSAKPAGSSSRDVLPWLVEAWLIGVAFFSLRTAGGFVLLQRQQRRWSSPVSGRLLEICRGMQRRIGLNRAIRFCECTWLQAPAVLGWFRPVVLLPVAALTGLSEDQLQSIIAHELAHIKRLDAFVNVFQICVDTLLFYHPAVWWLNGRIRAEREHCCDDMAVALCGNAVEYARALTLMEEWRSAPVLAMAANRGPLAERVLRLIGRNPVSGGAAARVGVSGSILCLAAALFAGNALVGIAYPKPTVYANGSALRQLASRSIAVAAQTQPSPQSAPAPAAKPSAVQAPRNAEQPASAQSYIDGLQAAGLKDLTADQLIALKIQGVTPEYVRALHELGLHPDADTCVGLRVQGVTPEYIKELRAIGFTPDEEQIIGLKVQGVNADYVRGLKEVGIQGDSDQIIGLKVQGVTPTYVRELRAAGLTVDSDDVIALKVQGVTPAYVHELRDQGFQPSADDVVGMKVQGITPEYIRDMRALGLNPGADEIIGMKVQGVAPEYVKALQAAGFKVSPDDVISAKVQGLTPEFIETARKHGFQNLTIEKLIELKHMGVLEAKGDI